MQITARGTGGGGTDGIGNGTAGVSATGADGNFTAWADTGFVVGSHLVWSLSAKAQGQVDGTSVGEAQAMVGGPAAAFVDDVQAVAFETALPDGTSVAAALTSAPIMNAAYGTTGSMFALGEFGGRYSVAGTTTQTTTSRIDLSLDVTQLSSPQDLFLGLYDPVVVGTGVTGVTLDVSTFDGTLLHETFANAAAARAYFTDNALDLGSLAAGSDLHSNSLDLSIVLTVTSDAPNSGFFADFALGQGSSDPLNLTGTSGPDILAGWVASDVLMGLAGNDSLNGGAGSDQLYGGTGNDTYSVDTQTDLVFENAGEGTDTVAASAGFYLYANIENLTLDSGAGDIFGVGNELANTITGNEGSNLLIAGAGNDTVHGGAGVDSLFGQDGADKLYGDAGIDYLVGGIGNDTLDGGADADALYGEDGNDTLWGGTTFDTDILVGGAGDDVLRGDSGLGDYDRMDGGAGNDSYYVDTGDDLTFEAANGGTDTVYANVAGANNGVYLYANVENLVLLGTTTFGVGNELANVLTGNASANWLLGGDGNDTLNGKAGNDVLFGQGGTDTFVFEHGTGGDVIGDFTHAEDKMDVHAFGFTSFADLQSHFAQVGNDGAIYLADGDFVVLQGVTMASLDAGDFLL